VKNECDRLMPAKPHTHGINAAPMQYLNIENSYHHDRKQPAAVATSHL
jgi:hypothetical protein